MEIKLDLNKHCIETEIRKVYNQALSRCLKNADAANADEHVITLAKGALETFDFRALRNAYPTLGGHTPVQVILCDINKKPHILLNDQLIEPPLRKRPVG